MMAAPVFQPDGSFKPSHHEAEMAYDFVAARLSYDPDTGVITRIRGQRSGKVAGCYRHGYRVVSIRNREFAQHRVAWLLTFKRWPEGAIDHKDGDRANNALSNLRLASISQNGANQRLSPKNTTGFKGVVDRGGKYAAFIQHRRKQRYLGIFETKELAAEAYATAAGLLFGEFANPVSDAALKVQP